jgi:hypothetical protein
VDILSKCNTWWTIDRSVSLYGSVHVKPHLVWISTNVCIHPPARILLAQSDGEFSLDGEG